MPCSRISFYNKIVLFITRRMKVHTIVFTCLLVLLYLQVSEAAKTPDPYKVLGISRSATQDDIKKAFNKRSRQYHPDINKEDPRAKQKFEKVVNAYELLKDPERKRMYDMTGSDDPNAGMGMGGGFGGGFPGGFGGGGFGINMEDILNMGFGGGFGGFGGGGGQQRRQGGQRTYTFTFGGGGGQPGGGYRFEM